MRNVKILSLVMAFTILSGVLCGCNSTPVSTVNVAEIRLSQRQIDEIGIKTDEVLKNNKFSGTTSVTLNGESIYKKSYGYSDMSKTVAITNKDRYQLGSLSKAFTGVAVLQLVAQDKINLSDTLDKYFEGKKYLSTITVQHLLEMRSGLASYTIGIEGNKNRYKYIKSFIEANPDDIKIKEYITKFILNHGTDDETGCFSHSHSDYYLLGLIIEKVSGLNYQDYIIDNILRPLNLTETDFINNDTPFSGYTDENEFHTNKGKIYHNNQHVMFAALGISSTAKDMNTFYEAILSNKVMGKYSSKISCLDMITSSSSGYSCGFYSGNKSIYTQGNTNIHSSQSYINTDTKEIAILLTNYDDVDKVEALAKDVYNITNAKINGIILDSLE